MLQYLALTDLMILNRGGDPTFVNAVRREVIDLTLCSWEIEPYLQKWRVSKETSLSDIIGVSNSSSTQRGVQLSLIEIPGIRPGSTTGRRWRENSPT